MAQIGSGNTFEYKRQQGTFPKKSGSELPLETLKNELKSDSADDNSSLDESTKKLLAMMDDLEEQDKSYESRKRKDLLFGSIYQTVTTAKKGIIQEFELNEGDGLTLKQASERLIIVMKNFNYNNPDKAAQELVDNKLLRNGETLVSLKVDLREYYKSNMHLGFIETYSMPWCLGGNVISFDKPLGVIATLQGYLGYK